MIATLFKRAYGMFALILCTTIVGLAGTDLILPAIPQLPRLLSGTAMQAQWVLAAFVFGLALGLLFFGQLASYIKPPLLLAMALTGYALSSLAATFIDSIESMILWRFAQGLSAAAPAVFAPGMIRQLFSEQGAIRGLGIMGSVESLTPALAPVLGAWLISHYNWQAPFWLIALLAGALAMLCLLLRHQLPSPPLNQQLVSYVQLLTNRYFMRLALSQACTLGGLLIFVFGAPMVITTSMHGDINDFVIMQLLGVGCFILAANFTGNMVARWGAESVILLGSLLSSSGLLLILLYAVIGGQQPTVLWPLFMLVNGGLGLRGPPGFYQAIAASRGNDAKAAALVVLFILLIAALFTALLAPVITHGLWPLAAISMLVSFSSVLLLQGVKSGLS